MSYATGAPRPGPALVLGRAAVLGAIGFGSGVVSHLAGGGRLPGTVALGLLLLVSVLASTTLLRTWASARRLVLAVVLAQGAWHLVLSLLAGHEGDPRAAATSSGPLVTTALDGRRTGSLHDMYAASAPSPQAPSTGSGEGLIAHQVAHLTEQGPLMVLTHLLGAVVLGLVLARGEATLRILVGLLEGAVVAVLDAGRIAACSWHTGRSAAVATSVVTVHRAGRLALVSKRRRGPPGLLVA